MNGYYIVCCKSTEESIKVQEFLFLNGIYWNSGSRKSILKDSDAKWLRITQCQIQACGESYKYLDGYYDHLNMRDYTFISVDKLIRKLKLEKLSSL